MRISDWSSDVCSSDLGGQPVMSWLVRAGDPLPKKGSMKFLAAEAIKAGSQNSLDFKLLEGEIESPVTDNQWVGELKITGSELEQGVIAKGAESSEEHTSELQSLMRISYAGFCLYKK